MPYNNRNAKTEIYQLANIFETYLFTTFKYIKHFISRVYWQTIWQALNGPDYFKSGIMSIPPFLLALRLCGWYYKSVKTFLQSFPKISQLAQKCHQKKPLDWAGPHFWEPSRSAVANQKSFFLWGRWTSAISWGDVSSLLLLRNRGPPCPVSRDGCLSCLKPKWKVSLLLFLLAVVVKVRLQ